MNRQQKLEQRWKEWVAKLMSDETVTWERDGRVYEFHTKNFTISVDPFKVTPWWTSLPEPVPDMPSSEPEQIAQLERMWGDDE